MAALKADAKKDNWEDIKESNFYFKKLKVVEFFNMI